MTKVLLIWEIVPEDIKFYMLEGETAELALKAHTQLVGTQDDNDAQALSLALEGVPTIQATTPFVIEGEPVTVVHSGIML